MSAFSGSEKLRGRSLREWEIQNVKCEVRSAKCEVQNAKCKMQNAECGVRSAKCKMQNAKCKMQNAKCKMRSAECGVRNAKCEMRSAECRVQLYNVIAQSILIARTNENKETIRQNQGKPTSASHTTPHTIYNLQFAFCTLHFAFSF